MQQSFEKPEYTFDGNYRAIVEDNEDPLDVGRARVRILGIHSLDPKLTPLEHLPWAEPCLQMSYSGGKNLTISSVKASRYIPAGNAFNPPARDSEDIDVEYKDIVMQDSGSGGIFVVPRKGTQLWVFFEAGNYTRPHYFAIASKAEDWTRQKAKIQKDVKTKIDEITQLRNKFTPDNATHSGSSCASEASVSVKTNQPKLKIQEIVEPNHQITTYTSPGGATYIFVNINGKERTYIIHKGTMEYVDEIGTKRDVVGTTNGKNNNLEHLVGNNYELHINGDYDIFVNKSCFIQVEGDTQINTKGNIGIVSREGDIDFITKKGKMNFDSAAGFNFHTKGNYQEHIEGNAITKIDKNQQILVKGTVDYKILKALKIKSLSFAQTSDTAWTMKAGTVVSQQAGTNFIAKASINMSLGGQAQLIMGPSAAISQTASIINQAGSVVNIGGVVNMQAASPGTEIPPVVPEAPTDASFSSGSGAKKTTENPE